MQQSENPKRATPESAWKLQEERNMQITLTPSHLADLSRSRERLNRLVFWMLTATLVTCAGSAFHHIVTVDHPWLRVGQILALAAVVYLMAPTLERGFSRRGPNEPSGLFLMREHEERRHGYLWIRRRLFLCVPSILASWWGVAQVRGFDTAFPAWQWLFLITGAGLILVWFAFGRAAEKAGREAEEVRRSMEC